jgi:signal transduction histidine kinase
VTDESSSSSPKPSRPEAPVGPRNLRRLLKASISISSALELRAVLQRVVEAAVDLVDARYGALGVLAEDGRSLAQFVTVGMDDGLRARIGDLPKGMGVLGTLFASSEPIRVADLREHPDRVGFPPGHPPMTSFLGVPIRVRDQVFGNLYLTDKVSGETFTDIDEELALGLASAAGVAIDNARLFERVRHRESTLIAMREIAAALLAGADPHHSLQLVASSARNLVDGDLATIAVPNPDGKTLLIEVADGPLGEGFAGEQFPLVGSVSGEVLRTGERIVVEDASTDHRTRQPQVSTRQLGPVVWVLLASEGHLFGTLSVGRPLGSAPFTATELDLVGSFAAQASVALAHERGRQDQQRLSLLEEGERIARDLHDSVIQRLFATGMSLQSIRRRVGDSDTTASDRLDEAIDELDATVREIRTVIFGLEDTVVSQGHALRSGVLEIVGESARVLGFTPEVSFSGPLDTTITEPISHDLLATLREALSNVARHAAAHHVAVSVSVKRKVLRLRVVDDGVGISTVGTEPGGRGLRNMRTRAEHIGGQLDIESTPTSGTCLTWEVAVAES